MRSFLVCASHFNSLQTRYIVRGEALRDRVANALACYRAPEPRNPKSASKSPKNAILDPPEKCTPKSIKMSKKSVFGELKCPKTGFLDILIDFGVHFSGVQNGIFRTFKCTFGVSGFRGSVAGQGVCKDRGSLKTVL